MRSIVSATVIGLALAQATASPASDVPANLVLDVRLYEARSSSPNFALFQDLSFFVDTDGTGVTEEQWLATLSRQIPQTYLAVLATDTLPVSGETATFMHELRSRGIELEMDLSRFAPEGTFPARVQGSFTRGGTELESLEREVELGSGMTYVWSSSELELSASDYLSHFREYDDREHRGRIYEYLRDYVMFLVVAVTPRIARGPGATEEPVEVSLPEGAELPEVPSPAGVTLVGTLVVDFDVDEDGVPGEPRVMRSTIPEVTPRLLGALENWRFPEAAGERARLRLEVRAEP